MTEPDYLFDKVGEAPADVARLEALLGRFRHGRRRPKDAPAEPTAPRGARRPWLWLATALAAAAVLMVAVRLWRPSKIAAGIDVVQTNGDKLSVDEWVEAKDQAQHLSMPSRGWLTLLPGGRLHVRRLDPEQGRFYLQQGSLEAFVVPSVQARFFQVETDAATCVDLGCKYTLDVDATTKVARVRVTLGQVEFVDQGRQVFVPRGAECQAVPGVGAGTPRFSDCAAPTRAALDAFDAARDAQVQRRTATTFAAACKTTRDTLPLWHLLAHADAEVRNVADAALQRLVGETKGVRTSAEWREQLDRHWW